MYSTKSVFFISHLDLVYTEEKLEQAISLDNKIGNFLRQCDGYIKGQLLTGDFNEADIIQRYVKYLKAELTILGAQWLSGRVLDWRPRCSRLEPHQRHCVVSLSKTHIILA